VSKANFPSGASAVIIATGLNYPDALAAASLAAAKNAPILLVSGGSVPSATLTELMRLNPSVIYVLGGTAAVPMSAENVLDDVAPVTRLAGSDRYATAIQISKATHSGSVDTVYIVAGTSFVDALVGGPVAASSGSAMLLVRTTSIPGSVVSELKRLSPSKIVVVGGAAIVSQSVVNQLRSYADSVESISGDDRYETGALTSEHGFPHGADTVLVTTGALFPDGLSASGVAGDLHAPVLLVKPNALPGSVADELVRLDPSKVRILGGSAAVSDSVVAAITKLLNG
jgi:putative cell wall-binding protein